MVSLNDAVEKFNAEFKQRSYSGRHPKLGKMKKCQVCKHRHRDYECPQVFATTVDHGKVACEPRIAPLPRVLRMPANPYWRPKPNVQVDLMLHMLRKKTQEAQAEV